MTKKFTAAASGSNSQTASALFAPIVGAPPKTAKTQPAQNAAKTTIGAHQPGCRF